MELLEALKVIRGECKKHDRCVTCPLRTYNGDSCMISEPINPDGWKFAGENTGEAPRLFK